MQKPVNQNASPEAAALLNYLEQTAGHGDYYGTAYPDKSYGGDYIYQGDYRKAAKAERF